MRDALMHFDDWAQGKGHGPQKDRRNAGEALRDVARAYWGFGYNPNAGTVSLGPYTIQVDAADQAVKALSCEIYQAAREVDQANAAELLARTTQVLATSGIGCSPAQEASLWVRVKDDSRVWLSLTAGDSDEHERQDLSERIIIALTSAGLRPISIRQGEDLEPAERLLRGEALYLEAEARPATP